VNAPTFLRSSTTTPLAFRSRAASIAVLMAFGNRGEPPFAGFVAFVICSANNPRQVQAIADAVEHALKVEKQRPTLVEGYARAEWILLDYFDFVIHVFSKHASDFYGLDRLWGSATRHEFPDVA
jgi:ribosome silencing factor RsfS/YbeB/iojap